jgi:hypothetical protein
MRRQRAKKESEDSSRIQDKAASRWRKIRSEKNEGGVRGKRRINEKQVGSH